ncbi:hypothetical protein [Phycisphaera mikurensis]|uniref:Lipoprotein n=1 Tax=Phycisphaera mikurensis (strain NBRC 102666 / KCTC 22515 / FYK2301M01) TaxID=1142394 RepID=I0IJ31_PHYMF|nr:hypothetical protein [Phycisphaera mikurensis]MBB6443116.1 hypothetical protein [Phycisphaera mikurensis]BAM05269.1 hypothetical protein PSMK_31100 [Phycisphaera mikurensis NBRC 102666]
MKRPPRLLGPLAAASALAAALLGGCASPSSLVVRGQATPGGPPVELVGDFDTAWYRTDDPNQATFVLLDGPPERPRQAAVIELFWRPRSGLTPVEPAATNMTVTHLVFAQRSAELGPGVDAGDRGELGVYAGAGFLFPRKPLGGRTLVAGVWDASLRLETRSEGFVDLLGLARMTGTFTATRDEGRVDELLRELSLETRDRLGFPRPLR